MPTAFKITSMQFLYNISELSYEVNVLYADNMKVFYKPVSLFLMDLARHVQIMWIKSAIF